ncbi:hypothetical protein F0562_023356 [Nyssa sinensis]|uniref:Protein kinase domain-containing protein n=1 Tax=Nyssa sinensis TaxID=561372 RepID=A0A5J5BHP7_9ASTE|nr:hypothetical protein F0562_023356 [Nyssa sinensis]
MVIQLAVGIILVLWLTKASAVEVAKPGCQDRCGDVVIPYPFGIGANCSADETFSITCNRSFSPHKPFISSTNLEVLEISLEGTVRVNNPVLTSNCANRVDGLDVSLMETPLFFSGTHNRFTAMGCDNLALITRQDTVIGGCMSICNITSRESTCFGINCCQTTIPPFLKFINASLRSIDPNNDQKECKYAFMVDQEWFTNLTDPYVVQNLENVPAVLQWRTLGFCSSFVTYIPSANSSVTLCGTNALCSNQSSNYLCSCDRGYEGNPYLPDGCQDIDECSRHEDNCEMSCVNTQGSYNCSCTPGYLSIGHRCYKLNDITPPNRLRMVIIGPSTGLGVLFLLVAAWWSCKILKRRKKTKLKEKFFKRNGGLLLQQQLSSGGEGNVEKTKLFTAKELEKATDHYNENRILGQGGQGTVYKGMLTDGRIVAVKKSKLVDERKLEQFINEVVILSQINHRNVVKLHGCCLETQVPLLVYEFVPNGTLYQYIHDQNEEFPLSWNMRVRIAAEIAGALSYLHSAASIPIFHRDIKSTNILLDDKYRAKVSDFGTSRSIAIDQTHLTTRVQGTFGYLDPEYFQSSQFTEKSDVYSFGVVLVELLTGQKPISSTGSEERGLATYFIMTMKENHLFDILDARVLKEGGKEEIMGAASLAKRCLNLNGRKRPTMKEVAMELEGIRMSHGAPASSQQICEEVEYIESELDGCWAGGSTLTGSSSDKIFSSSQPLLDTQE